jgi:ribonuclease PH
VNNDILLDLDYSEDSNAELDFNFVMTGSGKLIEIQGCAEKTPIDFELLNKFGTIAKKAISQLTAMQLDVLNSY